MKKQSASKSFMEGFTVTDQFLRVLEEHKKSCEREGKYKEAELTKKKLQTLRKHEDMKQKHSLLSTYNAELITLKGKYKEEIQTLVAKWDEKILAKYKDEATNQMFDVRKRQETEITALSQGDRRSKSVLGHCSPQILELRKKQESLVLFGKYKEAMKLRKEIAHLKERDMTKKNYEILEKLNQKSQYIQQKHNKEITALEIKIKTNWLRLWKQREKEMEVVKKKYKNAKNDILQKYKQDWLRLKKQSPVVRMAIKDHISNFQ